MKTVEINTNGAKALIKTAIGTLELAEQALKYAIQHDHGCACFLRECVWGIEVERIKLEGFFKVTE